MAVIDALLALLEHEVYPLIPAQGSVGASEIWRPWRT